MIDNLNSFYGPERDRTADLLNANQALSQLSYAPVKGYLYETGPKWARTTDTRVINTVLYQLSYGPKVHTFFITSVAT